MNLNKNFTFNINDKKCKKFSYRGSPKKHFKKYNKKQAIK